MSENRETCKHIATELEKVVNGDMFRCPECGETLYREQGENTFDSNTEIYTLPCGCCTPDEPEQLTLYEYFSDILDMEYRCGSDKEYRSCKIMVACGGPNIYIDTASAMVKLYWWTEYAEYPISYEARDAIDEWAEEYWNL